MKQNDWKIIYSNYSGLEKKAVNLLSKEAGRLLIREEMVYSIYVLPCEKEGCEVSKSAFFVGLYDESETIRKYVSESEIPEGGFAVKVIRNPEDEEGSFVFITARDEMQLFYAAVSFLDDYMPNNMSDTKSANVMADLIFDYPLIEKSYSQVPDHKIRSIFTWGHSTSDYRAYIDNMARLRLNELIIWNDHIPVNIDDVIEYAHSYGIKVVLGYSWGWREIGNKATVITDETIENLKKLVVKTYREKYAPVKCDGIYFQAFTERKEETVGGKSIARLVTDMVNDIADELWKITPELRLIFGLHASSVRSRLADIACVNPKVEILWEDCGSFPFNYNSFVSSEEKYQATLDYVKEILALRGGQGVGFAFKGIMMLDWTKKVGQRGPYVMGENAPEISNHDRRMRARAWRTFSSDWIKNGEYVHRMFKFIKENELFDTTMCVAGTLDGAMYLPYAMYAEMFYGINESYDEILQRVIRRPRVCLE